MPRERCHSREFERGAGLASTAAWRTASRLARESSMPQTTERNTARCAEDGSALRDTVRMVVSTSSPPPFNRSMSMLPKVRPGPFVFMGSRSQIAVGRTTDARRAHGYRRSWRSARARCSAAITAVRRRERSRRRASLDGGAARRLAGARRSGADAPRTTDAPWEDLMSAQASVASPRIRALAIVALEHACGASVVATASAPTATAGLQLSRVGHDHERTASYGGRICWLDGAEQEAAESTEATRSRAPAESALSASSIQDLGGLALADESDLDHDVPRHVAQLAERDSPLSLPRGCLQLLTQVGIQRHIKKKKKKNPSVCGHHPARGRCAVPRLFDGKAERGTRALGSVHTHDDVHENGPFGSDDERRRRR